MIRRKLDRFKRVGETILVLPVALAVLVSLAVPASAHEGRFDVTSPVVRVFNADAGTISFTITGIDPTADCYNDIVDALGEDTQDALALALAAQLSERSLSVWFERYGNATPQRCSLTHIELN